jgi:hypothetical protein
MGPAAAVAIDLGLMAIACLPGIVAFWRGAGIFRYLSVGSGLFGIPFQLMASQGPTTGTFDEFWNFVPGWILGTFFAAVAIKEAKRRT